MATVEFFFRLPPFLPFVRYNAPRPTAQIPTTSSSPPVLVMKSLYLANAPFSDPVSVSAVTTSVCYVGSLEAVSAGSLAASAVQVNRDTAITVAARAERKRWFFM